MYDCYLLQSRSPQCDLSPFDATSNHGTVIQSDEEDEDECKNNLIGAQQTERAFDDIYEMVDVRNAEDETDE